MLFRRHCATPLRCYAIFDIDYAIAAAADAAAFADAAADVAIFAPPLRAFSR